MLLDLWKEAKQKYNNLLDAWTSIVENEENRKKYQQARGKGGFRRSQWNEVLEIIAVSCI